jgi:hypothetical protein
MAHDTLNFLMYTGTWSGKVGATTLNDCNKCDAGTYSAAIGAQSEETCKLCDAGKWNNETGAGDEELFCRRCPAVSFYSLF